MQSSPTCHVARMDNAIDQRNYTQANVWGAWTSLGGSFIDPHVRAHFARQERTGAIRQYRLRDVTLDASLMLLLRGRSRISDTRYLVTDEEYAHTLVKPLSAIPLTPQSTTSSAAIGPGTTTTTGSSNRCLRST